jgi:ABC-2 type transport system ATP-binding protein
MSIQVQQLCKTFGTQKAVNHLNFEIGKGSITGFLGPNGAGKSTTMKMLSTYITPTSGTALVCGYDVQQNTMEVRRHLGYLPESNPLYFDMYVREYLEFVAGIHQLGKNKKSRVDEMIAVTGLTAEVKKKIGTLSKGYKQRVGIAQAMIHDPEVLILDEPTSGLDPNQIMDIRDLIIRLGKEKTILLSTHIMQEVQAMCDRIIIINKGVIVADDSISNIRTTAQDATAGIVVTFEKKVLETDLAAIKHVVAVHYIEENTWMLHSAATNLMRKEIMAWSLQHDVAIVALQESTRTLEEAFRDLTSGRSANTQ